MGLDRPPVWGRLLRSVEDPRQFYSFGPWRSRDDITAMRADPRSSEVFGRLKDLCDEMHPGMFTEEAGA